MSWLQIDGGLGVSNFQCKEQQRQCDTSFGNFWNPSLVEKRLLGTFGTSQLLIFAYLADTYNQLTL